MNVKDSGGGPLAPSAFGPEGGPRPLSSDHRRLVLALLLSLLFHALLAGLTFGGEGVGLPGFSLPWRERRVEAPELRVLLGPAPAFAPASASAAGETPPTPSEPALGTGPAPAFSPSATPPPRSEMAASIRPTTPPSDDNASVAPDAEARAAVAQAPVRDANAGRAAPAPVDTPAIAGGAPVDVPAPSAQALSAAPTPVLSSTQGEAPARALDVLPAPAAPSPQPVIATPTVTGEEAPQAARLDAARLDAARQEAERQQVARLAEQQQEAQRLEAARLEAERNAAARKEAERLAAEQQEARRQEASRREAERVEAERLAAARLEAQREARRREAERQAEERLATQQREAQQREAERQAAERLAEQQREAQRREAVRRETERLEAARLEAERSEAARREAERREAQQRAAERVAAEQREAQRLEAVRQESVRLDAERQEAARREAARQEAARQEAARQAVALQEAARARAKQEEEERREARLRAIGRQLDEEAARREQPTADADRSSRLPQSLSTARRARLWGRVDPNGELVRYAEAWALKIQLNTPVDAVREIARRPHTQAMVTVAIRSDGSVESVSFVRSSGVAEVDEAIRRIVQSHANYPAFPPGLVRDYDVVEIRRTWHFDAAVRLY